MKIHRYTLKDEKKFRIGEYEPDSSSNIRERHHSVQFFKKTIRKWIPKGYEDRLIVKKNGQCYNINFICSRGLSLPFNLKSHTIKGLSININNIEMNNIKFLRVYKIFSDRESFRIELISRKNYSFELARLSGINYNIQLNLIDADKAIEKQDNFYKAKSIESFERWANNEFQEFSEDF